MCWTTHRQAESKHHIILQHCQGHLHSISFNLIYAAALTICVHELSYFVIHTFGDIGDYINIKVHILFCFTIIFQVEISMCSKKTIR